MFFRREARTNIALQTPGSSGCRVRVTKMTPPAGIPNGGRSGSSWCASTAKEHSTSGRGVRRPPKGSTHGVSLVLCRTKYPVTGAGWTLEYTLLPIGMRLTPNFFACEARFEAVS